MLASVQSMQISLADAEATIAALKKQVQSLEQERDALLLSQAEEKKNREGRPPLELASSSSGVTESSSFPATSMDALRDQIVAYKSQLQAVEDLRPALELKEQDLFSREEALTKKSEQVEDHLVSEQVRINKLLSQATADSGAHVSSVGVDWYKVDSDKSPEQYEAYLQDDDLKYYLMIKLAGRW